MRHAESGTQNADVSALGILDHDIQTVESGPMRHGFLINRVEIPRGLEEGLWNTPEDDIFKCLNDAAAGIGNAAVKIQHRRWHALFALEGKVAIAQPHGDGNQVGVGGCSQKVRAVLEGKMVGNYARSDFFLSLFKMFGSMLNPAIAAEIFEPGGAGRHST